MVQIFKEVIINNGAKAIGDVERGNTIYEVGFCIDYCEDTTHVVFALGSKQERIFNSIANFNGHKDLYVVYDIDAKSHAFISILGACLLSVQNHFKGMWLDIGDEWIKIEVSYKQSLELDKLIKKIATDFEKYA